MREIEFRCWDGKKMIDDFFVQSNGDGVVFRKSIQAGTKIELMQFTGLKDKNGKEIYEGDIVRFWLQYGEIPKDELLTHDFAPVTWDAFDLQWSVLWKTDSWPLTGRRKLEVIGNIYENPDLLNKK